MPVIDAGLFPQQVQQPKRRHGALPATWLANTQTGGAHFRGVCRRRRPVQAVAQGHHQVLAIVADHPVDVTLAAGLLDVRSPELAIRIVHWT